MRHGAAIGTLAGMALAAVFLVVVGVLLVLPKESSYRALVAVWLWALPVLGIFACAGWLAGTGIEGASRSLQRARRRSLPRQRRMPLLGAQAARQRGAQQLGLASGEEAHRAVTLPRREGAEERENESEEGYVGPSPTQLPSSGAPSPAKLERGPGGEARDA